MSEGTYFYVAAQMPLPRKGQKSVYDCTNNEEIYMKNRIGTFVHLMKYKHGYNKDISQSSNIVLPAKRHPHSPRHRKRFYGIRCIELPHKATLHKR